MAKRATKSMPQWPGATLWKLDEIRPYPHNPRTHPPAQIDFIANLLRKFGPDQPIVVDEAAVILKGHGRLLSAVKAEMKTFPVVQRFGMSEEDKRAMRIADNQSALMSGWDGELMKFEIESLKRGGYDVSLLGFGEAQLVSFMTTPGPPGEFPAFGEDISTAFCCPNCQFVWSGRPDAGRVKNGPGGTDDPMRVRVLTKANAKGRKGKAAPVRQRPSLAGATKARKDKAVRNDDARRGSVDGEASKG